MTYCTLSKVPRVNLIDEDLLDTIWWTRKSLSAVLIVDGNEYIADIINKIKRSIRIEAINPSRDDILGLDVDLVIGVGNWRAINKAKILTCTLTANGQLGLLGVKKPVEKAYMVLIPSNSLRLTFSPRIIIGEPHNMILEHPCAIPHEILLLRKYLDNSIELRCERKLLEILLPLKHGINFNDPSSILEAYTVNLGIIDALTDALVLVGVDPVTSIIVSSIVSVRLGLVRLDISIEREPLEKLISQCCKPQTYDIREDVLLENVIRSTQLYHGTPPPPRMVKEAVKRVAELLRNIQLYNKPRGLKS